MFTWPARASWIYRGPGGLQADQIWPGHTGEGLGGILERVQVLSQAAQVMWSNVRKGSM